MGAETSKLNFLKEGGSPEEDVEIYINVVQTGNSILARVILKDMYNKYRGNPSARRAISTLKQIPFAVSHLPSLDPLAEFDIDKTLAKYADTSYS